MGYREIADKIGISASTLCIVHCVGTLTLALLLPTGILSSFFDERVHTYLAFSVLLAGLFAFIPGYQVHRKKIILISALIGMLLIITPHILPGFGESLETGFTIFGGGILVFSHLRNRHYCKACESKFMSCIEHNGKCSHK